MKKTLRPLAMSAAALMATAALFALPGCSDVQTSQSYTFNVSTGDKVEVELDTSSGLSLAADQSTFIVSRDGQELTRGLFFDFDAYEEYAETAPDYPTYVQNKVRGNPGFYYSISDDEGNTEYNYLIKLNDSNTAIALCTSTSEEDATEVTSHLIFTVNAED